MPNEKYPHYPEDEFASFTGEIKEKSVAEKQFNKIGIHVGDVIMCSTRPTIRFVVRGFSTNKGGVFALIQNKDDKRLTEEQFAVVFLHLSDIRHGKIKVTKIEK